MLLLQLVDQGNQLPAFGRVLQPVIIVAKDRLRIGFVGVLEGLGDEIRPDDLQPERIAQEISATVSDRLVDHVPDLDLTFIPANHRVNMVAHPFEQLLT